MLSSEINKTRSLDIEALPEEESRMENESTIARLFEFKSAMKEWEFSLDSKRKSELRTFLNENKIAVKREVAEAGCYLKLEISPPPVIGGHIMRDVDPFDMMFNAPYNLSMVQTIADMIDQTIGVLKAGKKENNKKPSFLQLEVTDRYTFVAMPMDPNNADLEDVIDAIKETARQCGLKAERVDEPQYNERITDRILESIRRAQYVIVDLTYLKPNVFYEAGYAQGVGKTPIYIARTGTNLEFDLKDYPVIFFKNMKQLKELLEKRLRWLNEQAV